MSVEKALRRRRQEEIDYAIRYWREYDAALKREFEIPQGTAQAYDGAAEWMRREGWKLPLYGRRKTQELLNGIEGE